MEILYALAVAAAALLVAAGVSAFTRNILQRQALVAARLNELAGILRIKRVEEYRAPLPLREILQRQFPSEALRILGASGSNVLQLDFILDLLRQGVRIRVLLLDPNSGQLSLEPPWLAEETFRIIGLANTLMGPRTGDLLEIRLYRWPQMQELIFVDEKRLFVSSSSSISHGARLTYEIQPGDLSLYHLYRDGFEYLWAHASPVGGMSNDSRRALEAREMLR